MFKHLPIDPELLKIMEDHGASRPPAIQDRWREHGAYTRRLRVDLWQRVRAPWCGTAGVRFELDVISEEKGVPDAIWQGATAHRGPLSDRWAGQSVT